jgi:hypothetical protein
VTYKCTGRLLLASPGRVAPPCTWHGLLTAKSEYIVRALECYICERGPQTSVQCVWLPYTVSVNFCTCELAMTMQQSGARALRRLHRTSKGLMSSVLSPGRSSRTNQLQTHPLPLCHNHLQSPPTTTQHCTGAVPHKPQWNPSLLLLLLLLLLQLSNRP